MEIHTRASINASYSEKGTAGAANPRTKYCSKAGTWKFEDPSLLFQDGSNTTQLKETIEGQVIYPMENEESSKPPLTATSLKEKVVAFRYL